ncbi:MAG TPA: cytochrome c biogenesis protein CcsA, partial [Chitinophagaceae bacterium]|nr:cytochrome c biogenesis protein CcsA [Chitinophagaceae bacterium]
MNFIGEHLLPGQLGHFFVILSFIASLIATVAYFKSTNALLPQEALSWKKLARAAFITECFSVFSVFIIIYYIIATHKFEYTYAWNHSSRALSAKYLFSCIWEAQEGSFLLWTIWHCVLGLVLMFRAGKWEAPVMTVISFAQVCLATMIIGLYFGHTRVGINPFLLVRQLENMQNAPIFSRPDYLSIPMMQDGQGLNQLLQNYWMVIHPPVLFLGFASTIVPFAYAMAGLWKKEYTGWTKVALPWTLFSAGILGLGIMMGAAWAYESLTFGGFWAWDPVENASLVPWLVMVAGLHTQVVYNATGHSLRATYLFFIFSFFLILFSTFLTRSGVLGESSVHAFVENDMNFQLISFMAVFFVPALILYGIRYKEIPHIIKEESSYSREFWMFIGSLVLFLAALVIIWQTSFTPIYNKLAGKNTAMPEDPEFAYNKIQIFVAVVLGILTAIGQYLRYKDTPRKIFLQKIGLPTLVALVIALLISFLGDIHYYKQGYGYLGAIHLAIFASVYGIVANAVYMWTGLNGKLKAAGGSIAHLGFGLMLLGILISSAKKDVLSKNNGILLNFAPETKQDPTENLTLIKGLRTDMGRYWATYQNKDSTGQRGNITYFKIDFEHKTSGEKFTLYPNFIKATKGQEGVSGNPDSRHYWNKDIFTYVSATSLDDDDDTAQFRKHSIRIKDTIFYSRGFMVLNNVSINPAGTKHSIAPNDTLIVADLSIFSADSMRYRSTPAIYWKGNDSRFIFDTVFAQGLAVGFT